MRQRLTIKAALVLGFGLTLGLWLFTGYRFTRSAASLEERAAGVATRYVQAQDLLASLRARTLSTSGLVRDALLDVGREPVAVRRAALEEALGAMHEDLAQYDTVFDSPRALDGLTVLRREQANFGGAMRIAMDESDLVGSTAAARAVMNRVVIPHREALRGALDELQAINRHLFIEHQSELNAAQQAAERRTWWQVSWALALTLFIATIAITYAAGLERRLRTELDANEQARRSLQQLSTRLIGVQEGERRRIARELHDEVGQALTAIKVELAVASSSIRAGGHDHQLLDDVQHITEGALQTVRDLSHLLRPPVLDDMGLSAAVESHLRDFSRRTGVKGELVRDFEVRLSSDVEVAAYRIIQEALTNVARHAHATTCRVTLSYREALLTIVVEDDGVGLPPETSLAERRGLGILGMKERAAQFGGSVRLDPAGPRGTRVTIQIPTGTRAEAVSEVAPAASLGIVPANG